MCVGYGGGVRVLFCFIGVTFITCIDLLASIYGMLVTERGTQKEKKKEFKAFTSTTAKLLWRDSKDPLILMKILTSATALLLLLTLSTFYSHSTFIISLSAERD